MLGISDNTATDRLLDTVGGGGAVTAMFASRGASVFVYYSETDGQRDNRHTNEPARLDWDLLNAMSYLRVHWLVSPFAFQQADSFILSIHIHILSSP